MKTIIATLMAATLSAAAFANETTHNGQPVRDTTVVAAVANSSDLAGFQGYATSGQNVGSGAFNDPGRGANSGN